MRGTAIVGMAALVAALVGPVEAEDAYVPNQGSNNLTIFDVRNPADTTTRALGSQPHETVGSLDARYVFVSNRLNHNVSVFDARTRAEIDVDGNPANGITRIGVGLQPHGLAVTPDNRYLFVTNDGSASVSVIDLATLAVVSTVTGIGSAPHMVAIRPDGREAWVGNVGGGDVTLIDVARAIGDPANARICVTPGGTGAQCRIPTGAGVEGLAFTRNGRFAYAANGGANTVSVIDVAARVVVATLPVPGSPRRVHVSPDGRRAYVSQLFGNDVAVIDTATSQLVPGERIVGVPNGLGMDFRGDGARLYVSNFFSSAVTVVSLPDTATRQTIPAGSNPDSVAVLREEVFGVRFGDQETLSWPRNWLAERYDVYRGTVATLPDYGLCVNVFDPDPTDEAFVDIDTPPTGEVFFYLVGIRHSGGIAGVLGWAADGAPREPAVHCSP